MKKLAFTLLLLLSGTMIIAQNTDKISSGLLSEFQQKDQVGVIIVLTQQFDTKTAGTKYGKFEKGAYVKKHLLETARENQENLLRFLTENHVKHKSYYIINAIYADVDKQTLFQIADFPEVKHIILDYKIEMIQPEYNHDAAQKRAGIEWGIQMIKADSVWEQYETKGEGIVISGQDTGYEWNHPALKAHYRGWNEVLGVADHDYNWFDAVDTIGPRHDDPNLICDLNSEFPCDDHGHGTHTMGTMVGDDGGSNQIGVAPGTKWIGARNMDRGSGYFSWSLDCFQWFLAPYRYGEEPEDGNPFYAPHIINNSWGGAIDIEEDTIAYNITRDAILTLRNAGIFVVAAAGNSGSNCQTILLPALLEEVYAVGNIRQDSLLSATSSRGPFVYNGDRVKPDIAAPGTGIRSSIRGGNYGNNSGTSMASPHVAGAAALLMAAAPFLIGNVAEIEHVLSSTAIPRWVNEPCGDLNPEDVPNNEFGHGILDVLAAVKYALDVLPIRLLHFSGQAFANGNVLLWKTTDERNFSHFEIERSPDGLSWETVIKKPGTDRKNSSAINDYQAIDEEPLTGKNYYRLRQVDRDGAVVRSDVILIYSTGKSADILLYPNPSSGTINFKSSDMSGLMGSRFELFDIMGQKRAQEIINSARINLDLPSGLYFYRLTSIEGYPLSNGKIIMD